MYCKTIYFFNVLLGVQTYHVSFKNCAKMQQIPKNSKIMVIFEFLTLKLV